jgi:hypothetical protein
MKINVICLLSVLDYLCFVDCHRTFIPYCSLATRGLLEMNSKRPRFTLKGMGTMRETKRSISKTRSPKTCAESC